MLDFDYWAAVDGAAWKSRMEGHRKDNGELMDFLSYRYIRTNEYGKITHWETHDNADFDNFLQVAI
ncbi:hypothetical protein M9Y10_004414 [Tritrichomonas musculus]|uniref:Uncharacterized protein n=1 Tax=Tritrichomonas musculus TaxID=1915356 RepID=A0ABR2JRV8_9EUKA